MENAREATRSRLLEAQFLRMSAFNSKRYMVNSKRLYPMLQIRKSPRLPNRQPHGPTTSTSVAAGLVPTTSIPTRIVLTYCSPMVSAGPPHHPHNPILPRLAVPCPLRHPSPAVCPYAPVAVDSLPRLLPVPLTYAMPSPIPRPHVAPLAFLHPSPALPSQPCRPPGLP